LAGWGPDGRYCEIYQQTLNPVTRVLPFGYRTKALISEIMWSLKQVAVDLASDRHFADVFKMPELARGTENRRTPHSDARETFSKSAKLLNESY
jgi:hypothetical protein